MSLRRATICRRAAAAGALLVSALGALVLSGCGAHAKTTSTAAASPLTTTAATASRVANVPDGDWTSFDYDAQRSGVDPNPTGITAANLARLRIRVVHLNGTVDSSAIALHAVSVDGRRRDVIVVTTTYGRTIAIDPGTGARLWEFTPGDISSFQGSSQVATTSPVADPDRRYVYAASPDGLIHKLALATGRDVRSGHWPARITFDPTHEKLASALNLSGNWVVATTSGYFGDAPPYQGHVVLINRSDGVIAHVFNALCSNRHQLIDPPSSCPASDAAIWARAGAVLEPGSRRILVATGNAPFNGSTNWGDSVLELSSDASRLEQNWTPVDQAQLSDNDTDLGSTAPALLPGHLAVQGGKAGVLSLLNLNALDGTSGGPGPRLGGELQDIPSPGSGEVVTAPAVWSHAGTTYVFVSEDSGTAAYVLQRGPHPRLRVRWQNGNSGTSPVLAGGLLYVFDESAGALRVYSPTSGHQLASLPAQSGHWNSPIVVGGRIILPVGSYFSHSSHGTLLIYHLAGR